MVMDRYGIVEQGMQSQVPSRLPACRLGWYSETGGAAGSEQALGIGTSCMACIHGMARMEFSGPPSPHQRSLGRYTYGTGCDAWDCWQLGPTGHGKLRCVAPWHGGQRTHVLDLTRREVCCGPRRIGCVVTVGVTGKGLDVVVIVMPPGGPSCVLT